MIFHRHSYTSPADHPNCSTLYRTEATVRGQRLVFVHFERSSPFALGERRVGREVYAIEDGLEIHVGYLSQDAEARFARDLAAWLLDAGTKRTTCSGREMAPTEVPFGSFDAEPRVSP